MDLGGGGCNPSEGMRGVQKMREKLSILIVVKILLHDLVDRVPTFDA